MSNITLSKAVRSNLLNLQSTAASLAKSQERLSTGLKVNSALDNPTNFFTAEGLKSKANDLSALSDAVSNAVQTVAAADKGITAITKLVESAQATARQALQSATTVTTATAATTTGTTTASGLLTAAGLSNGQSLSITIGSTTKVIGFNNTGTAGGGQDAAVDLDGANDATDTTDDATLTSLVTAINTAFGSTVAAASSNKLQVTATNTADSITIASGAAATALGLTTTAVAPGSTTSANPKRAELVDTYNDLLGQIDALAKDAGYNGVNLLANDDLSVLFNEDGSSKLDINGVTDTAAGLGLTALTSTSFDSNTSINATLDDLKGAIDTLKSQSAKFGSNLSVVETRQDFTKGIINVLETGASNLTLADTNEEAANVLALQTRQQLSSTALSLASSADQNVLRLF
jgi:flagellin-like hook-associated protein FlgL